jgi:Tfp pilus assembly protein PilX
MKLISTSSIKQRKKGFVLLWSMVILLVLLIMGVGVTQLTGLDTRLAGNEMYRMLAFQSAESGLERTADLYYIDQASKAVNRSLMVNGLQDTIDIGAGAVQTIINVNVELSERQVGCPYLSGLANSIEATSESNQVACQLYSSNSVASLPRQTGAVATHELGLIKLVPSVNGQY